MAVAPTIPVRWLLPLFVVAAWCIGTAHAQAQLGSLLSPGPLARPHASLEGAANCLKCHEQGRRVSAQKCLACHAPVAERIARKRGVHRDVTGECEVCHAEHAGADGELRPFDTTRFDHAVSGFPLTGRHAPGVVPCAGCHKGRSYLAVTSTCVSCHADVHKGTLGTNCASCHSTHTAFKGSAQQFDHTKAAFALTGAHRAVACASCHATGTFKGVKYGSCADCHTDPHRPAQGAVCTSCHTTDAWKTTSVNHDRTDFKLAGLHARVACAACHRQPALRTVLSADRCATCHADPHKGEFAQDCASCHTASGWTAAAFDHGSTTFPLSGGHGGLACVACHKPGAPPAAALTSRRAPGRLPTSAARAVDFRGLQTGCVTCHEDVHQSDLGVSCESCHSTATFSVRQFAHRRADAFFDGGHADVRCAQCHAAGPPTQPARSGTSPHPVRFSAATRTCTGCHQDVHLGQLSASCETCHAVATPRFAVALDHARQTRFALQGRHATVACTECHKVETGRFPAASGSAVRFTGVATECRGCHADVHLGQLATACETCHTQDQFELKTYRHRTMSATVLMTGAHAKAACADCHKRSTGRFPSGTGTATRFLTGTTCVSCHADEHRGALGPNCASCHRP
jgi:hypothetical protein